MKKKKFLFSLLIVPVICLLYFVTNSPIPVCEKSLQLPGNIWSLETSSGSLCAVHSDNALIWEWDNLNQLPKITGIKEDPAVLLGKDLLVTWEYYPHPPNTNNPAAAGFLKLISLETPDGTEVRKINVGKIFFIGQVRLGCSRNGLYAAIALPVPVSDEPLNTDYDVKLGIFKHTSKELEWIHTVETTRFQPELSLFSGDPHISAVGVNEDGTRIAAVASWAGPGWILVADTTSKKVLWSKVMDKDPYRGSSFNDLSFSPDGKNLFVGSLLEVIHFETDTGKVKNYWELSSSIKEPNPVVHTIEVSPDGRLVAVGGGDKGYVFLFDANTGEQIGTLRNELGPVLYLTFSPDSKRLATYSGGTWEIKIWKLPSLN